MRRSKFLVVLLVAATLVMGGLAALSRSTAADPPGRESKDAKASQANAPPAKKADDSAKEGVGRFMRQKLAASNQVLEGLVTEDFALIEKGAATMQKLSAAEQWQVSNDAMYRQQSNQFRRVMEQLQKKAKDKQIDGAALSWMEGTMSCLECHKWVRSTLVAR